MIDDSARIEVRNLRLGEGVHIGPDVVIQADTLEVGCGTRIEARCLIAARFIRIGEQSLLGHDTKLIAPVGVIGDYVTIHNHCLLNGRQPLVVGHNCWVGQNCILNAEARLTIGNNVGIGAYSSVFTHGYFGDLLEGCQVFKIAPITIEDDVWILGSYNTIYPGVTLGEKCLVLPGSIVTDGVPPNCAVGGTPATIKHNIVPYREVPLAEKFERIQAFAREFLDTCHAGRYQQVEGGFLVGGGDSFRILFTSEVSELPTDRPLLVFVQHSTKESPDDVTVFDLGSRQYTRTRSKAEIQMITFLKYRARFVPADQPHVRYGG